MGMLRGLILLALTLIVLGAAEAVVVPAVSTVTPPPVGQLIDRSIRYVNGRVITLGDLVAHLQNNRPAAPPTNAAEEAAVWQKALERYTDETLLVLFAEEKGVEIDPAVLGKRILDDLKRAGRLATPDEIITWRNQLERREKIRAALGFFDMRTGNITPQELAFAYIERREQFRRPARAHVLQFVLRAASDEERAELVDRRAALFRRAQEIAGPVADLAATFLDRLLAVAADDEAKDRLLVEVTAAIAELDEAKLGEAGRKMRSEAVVIRDRAAQLRRQEDVEIDVEAIRSAIAAGDEQAFRKVVQARSEGPRKQEGGDLGWIERGAYTPAFDEAVFSGPVGAVGPIFWVGEACCVAYVMAREDAAQRSFAEVCGELENQLRKDREDAIFNQAAMILRERATIRDLLSINELINR